MPWISVIGLLTVWTASQLQGCRRNVGRQSGALSASSAGRCKAISDAAFVLSAISAASAL